ncbi:hypothetical protein V8E53_001598 [Lactarius tabidus]
MDDTQRPAPIQHAPSPPTPDGILCGTATPMRDPFPSFSYRIHPTASASSYLREEQAKHGSAIHHPIPESQTTMTAGENCTHPSLVQDQGRKPTPLLTLNKPTPEQAFLAKNYDENAQSADRDPRGNFFCTPTDASAGPLRSSSFPLPTVERALAETEGRSTGATLGGPERRVGTLTSPILGSPTQREVVLFESANLKDHAASPGTSALSFTVGMNVLLTYRTDSTHWSIAVTNEYMYLLT